MPLAPPDIDLVDLPFGTAAPLSVNTTLHLLGWRMCLHRAAGLPRAAALPSGREPSSQEVLCQEIWTRDW